MRRAVIEYVKTGRKLLGRRSSRIAIKADFYYVKYMNAEYLRIGGDKHCFVY